MRGINKGISETLYESVKNTLNEKEYTDFSRQGGDPVFVLDNIRQAVEDMNMQGGDISYNFVSYDDDTNTITLGAYAIDQNSESLEREFTITPKGISYDAIYDALEEWDSYHNTPDVFYEGVMVQTGSTTVTSDETGVSIEDNGNTITTGNGVVVSIDNEVDTLPVEDEFEETEETFEEVPSEDEVEETEEELIEPNEDGTIDDAPVNEEVLEKTDEETEEERNNSRVEESIDESSKSSKRRKLKEELSVVDTIEPYLDVELEDDETPTGGTSFAGETVRDFIEELPEENYTLTTSLKKLNKDLKDCGIKPIKPIKLDNYKKGKYATDIEWVVDEPDDKEYYNLPTRYKLPSNIKDEEVSDYLSDRFGFLVNSCNIKLEESADGYDNFQNIEVYQNPEVDYSMLDITELDTVENGDVRSVDMGTILADLDESLTEHFNNPNWGEINSFLTRKGTHKKTNESYSSAILELTLPKLNESVNEFKNVYILEVYGDKRYKNCIIRDSKSKVLENYSGKSRNPVKFFENFILKLMKEQLSEGVEIVKPLKRVKDKDIVVTNVAKDERITKSEERQDKLRKTLGKRYKTKKFDAGEEPDQKYKFKKAITEGYSYNWKDDIEDVTDTADDETYYAVAENIVDTDKYGEYAGRDRDQTIMEEMSNIINLFKIEKRSRLYNYLIDWYGSEEELLNKVRDVYDAGDAIYFVTGSGYSLFDADLLGGNADGETEKKFNKFIENGGKREITESLEDNQAFWDKGFKVGDKVDTKGAGEVEILDMDESANYILVRRLDIPVPFFVAAWNPEFDGKVQWGQGHYYGDEKEARAYFNSKKNDKLKEAEEVGLIDVEDNIGEEDIPADALDEDMTDVAIFHRKPASVDAMRAAEKNGITTNKSNYRVIGTKELTSEEFNKFANHLSSEEYEWLKDFDTDTDNSGMFSCIEVKNKEDNSYSLLVDPSGYSYARYVAIKEDNEANEDTKGEEDTKGGEDIEVSAEETVEETEE